MSCVYAQACLELQSEAVDFLQQRLGGGPGGGAGTPALTVLAVDATANAAELSLLKESLVEVGDTVVAPGSCDLSSAV